ncbi:hypothetical protein Asulf_01321 [Archaeoglobus sulfaticallidus PM70-1]|uniref:Uncharacterized protein n=1 Tax=Archaeoglobus sulfaticallidus PM70-1 TaxID=387631 RepID=N0BG87_9EURY|nr:hypothetical protein [Archaeoglobus sulfaticallidus]AGK61312.1 hypothetical protein Asulf_01321 [Archaeoglobus sulfaticallidus PM70-1]
MIVVVYVGNCGVSVVGKANVWCELLGNGVVVEGIAWATKGSGIATRNGIRKEIR